MDQTIVISVDRKVRPFETALRRLMAVLTAVFLLQGILFSSGFMLPCFAMAIAYYVYRHASRREYEYTLGEGMLKVERVGDTGRRVLWEIPLARIRLLCPHDAPEADPYRKGGGIKVRKYDYTSYREEIPYYTMILEDEGKIVKLLLDLTPEAIRMIRAENPEAVKGC